MPEIQKPGWGWGRLIALGLVWCGAQAELSAQQVNYGDVGVYLLQEAPQQFAHGYMEYRLRVTNRSTETDHRVAIVIPTNDSSGGQNGFFSAIRREVQVAKDSSAVISLYQPANPTLFSGSSASVFIDGKKQSEPFPLGTATGRRASSRIYGGPFGGGWVAGSSSAPIDYNFLFSQQCPEPALTQVAGSFGVGRSPSPVAPTGFGPTPTRATVVSATVPKGWKSPIRVSQWSDSWLGYSSYDMVFLRTEEWKELGSGGADTRAIWQALVQYVESGGTLAILGNDTPSLPKGWFATQTPFAHGGCYHAGLGLCLHVKTPPTEWLSTRPRPPGGGLPGRVFIEEMRQYLTESTGVWQRSSETSFYQSNFPVVDDLSVPIRGLFVLMILFAVVIGPVNFLMLSKWNKRIWLLWTVPAISLVFCLAILFYNAFSEGFFSGVRYVGFTYLDQPAQRASTIGLTGFYCPLNPGAISYSSSTELTIQQEDHPVWSSNPVLDWTKDQSLASGWVMARTPTYFTMRKAEERRERLNLRPVGGGFEATNALGADIRKLTYMDSKGKLHESGPIPAGGTAKLSAKAALPETKEPGRLRSYFVSGMWNQSGTAYDDKQPGVSWERALRPGTYIATIESTPFLENGIPGAYVRPSPSLVFGVVGDLAEAP